MENGNYKLIDSGVPAGSGRKGTGWRLEQFGPRIISRPSSTSIWLPRDSASWKRADAKYLESGDWQPEIPPWECQFAGVKLRLRAQRNGQVGVFPEHASYLHEIGDFITTNRGAAEIEVLNLFAYTGMASIFCAKQGAKVTHVDIQKSACGWCRENLELNGISDGVRVIEDDALAYLKREANRQRRYSVVIMDPPSFSRPKKGDSWELEDVLPALLSTAVSVLRQSNAMLVVTCHHPVFDGEVVANLIKDQLPQMEYQARRLYLEDGAGRKIPAGSLMIGRW